MIHDHRYDAGWPRDDSHGCQVVPESFGLIAERCGEPEEVHMLSEYPSQRPARGEGTGHRQTSNQPEAVFVPAWINGVGDMHEPKAYPFPLDWDDDRVLHPFID